MIFAVLLIALIGLATGTFELVAVAGILYLFTACGEGAKKQA